MTKRLCCQSVAESINSAGSEWSQTSFSCFVIWWARPHFYQLSSQYKWRACVFVALHHCIVSAYRSTVWMCVCMFIFVCEPIIIPLVLHLPYAWLPSNLLCKSGWHTHKHTHSSFLLWPPPFCHFHPVSLFFLSHPWSRLQLNHFFFFSTPLYSTMRKFKSLKGDCIILCTKNVLQCACMYISVCICISQCACICNIVEECVCLNSLSLSFLFVSRLFHLKRQNCIAQLPRLYTKPNRNRKINQLSTLSPVNYVPIQLKCNYDYASVANLII